MTLWELACYFAVFLGGVAGGWITCAVFTAARVNELGSECAQLAQKLLQEKSKREADIDCLIERTTECELLKAKLQTAEAALEEKQEYTVTREQVIQAGLQAAAIVAMQKLLRKPPPPAEQSSNPSA